MQMYFERRGQGKPLLLIHGIGGSWKSWNSIIDGLASHREVLAVDLPGHGKTPALSGEVSIRTLADAVTLFLQENNITGIDAVGSSMSARFVLELVRRGNVLGAVVSLDPGGFWKGWEIPFFYNSIAASIRLVRLLQPVMPGICKSALGRSLLLLQFSKKPSKLSPQLVLDEMRAYAASPSFNELLRNLAYGEPQLGLPSGSVEKPLVIGWGRNDRVCFPKQASRAMKLFPDATLHWFENCGHFPHWDAPQRTIDLILKITDLPPTPSSAERMQRFCSMAF